jgi:hypothetical protein
MKRNYIEESPVHTEKMVSVLLDRLINYYKNLCVGMIMKVQK